MGDGLSVFLHIKFVVIPIKTAFPASFNWVNNVCSTLFSTLNPTKHISRMEVCPIQMLYDVAVHHSFVGNVLRS